MENANQGVVAEARTLVEDYIKPELVTVTEPITGVQAPAMLTASGLKSVPASTFDDYRPRPSRRKGTATLLDLDSLIAHVERFKDDDTVLFANDDRASPSLVAVLDYHHAGGGSDARFGEHRARFAFPLSDEWKAWSASNKKPMSMIEFAAFLEDRIIDVLDDTSDLPKDMQRFVSAIGGNIASPTKLMETAVGLKVHEKSNVGETVNLASGEGEISFVSTHTDGAGKPLKVPNLFLIGIPVFKNDPAYRIAVRLRYRKRDGGLTFWYELWRQEPVFDHAFGEALERVRKETKLPILLGSPEA
jgi:uncharacterized protein YfdQ (DUF2303 family)